MTQNSVRNSPTLAAHRVHATPPSWVSATPTACRVPHASTSGASPQVSASEVKPTTARSKARETPAQGRDRLQGLCNRHAEEMLTAKDPKVAAAAYLKLHETAQKLSQARRWDCSIEQSVRNKEPRSWLGVVDAAIDEFLHNGSIDLLDAKSSAVFHPKLYMEFCDAVNRTGKVNRTEILDAVFKNTPPATSGLDLRERIAPFERISLYNGSAGDVIQLQPVDSAAPLSQPGVAWSTPEGTHSMPPTRVEEDLSAIMALNLSNPMQKVNVASPATELQGMQAQQIERTRMLPAHVSDEQDFSAAKQSEVVALTTESAATLPANNLSNSTQEVSVARQAADLQNMPTQQLKRSRVLPANSSVTQKGSSREKGYMMIGAAQRVASTMSKLRHELEGIRDRAHLSNHIVEKQDGDPRIESAKSRVDVAFAKLSQAVDEETLARAQHAEQLAIEATGHSEWSRKC